MLLLKRLLILITVFAMLTVQLCAVGVSAVEIENLENAQTETVITPDKYGEYVKKLDSKNGDGYYSLKPLYDNAVNGVEVKIISSGNTVTADLEVQTAGIYNIGVGFMPYGMYDRYSVSLTIDGDQPFTDAGEIEFYSAFKSSQIKQDTSGNDMLPKAEDDTELCAVLFKNSSALYENPYTTP